MVSVRFGSLIPVLKAQIQQSNGNIEEYETSPYTRPAAANLVEALNQAPEHPQSPAILNARNTLLEQDCDFRSDSFADELLWDGRVYLATGEDARQESAHFKAYVHTNLPPEEKERYKNWITSRIRDSKPKLAISLVKLKEEDQSFFPTVTGVEFQTLA